MAFGSILLSGCFKPRKIALLGALVLLSGCKSLTSTPAVTVDSGQAWAMLPIENLSTTPLAGQKAASLVETRLRGRGVVNLQSYSEPQPASLAALLDGGLQAREASQWARAAGFRYAVTGVVSEWHYKSGSDKEPAVGLTLKVVDLPTGQVLWQAAGSRTGWGYSNLSRIGDKVVGDLIGRLKIRRQSDPVINVAQVSYPPTQNNASAAFAASAATRGLTPSVPTDDQDTSTEFKVPSTFASDEFAEEPDFTDISKAPERLKIPGAEYRPSSSAADLLIESLENTN